MVYVLYIFNLYIYQKFLENNDFGISYYFKVSYFFPFKIKFLFLVTDHHLRWRSELSDKIVKGNHPGTIPARFGLIWFSGFR